MFIYQLCVKCCVTENIKTKKIRPRLPGAYNIVGKIA